VFVVYRRASRRERYNRAMAESRRHLQRVKFYGLSIRFHLAAARHARERQRERSRWARECRLDAQRVLKEPHRRVSRRNPRRRRARR